MKFSPKIRTLALFTAAMLSLAGCATDDDISQTDPNLALTPGETLISLSDNAVLVEGEPVSQSSTVSVYEGADIIYYEAGRGEGYGEGTTADEHTAQEADAHTVLTITSPGTYRATGTLSQGQLVVDLGQEARENPEARVTLILDDVDLTCTVAPAILVKNAYECGSAQIETATHQVDTGDAGFTLVLADDSENVVSGSYVAKIYEPGTTDKLYKYDAAIESLVSFNIDGESLGNGILTVNAQNEGIESHLHLTINAGDITIFSKDDSINANEDFVSVLTVNGGHLQCTVSGGSEGDGLDSNGYIVINGGHIIAAADPNSQDSGLDSDLGIYLNGGTVLASGNMYDEISSDSTQPYAVMQLRELREGGALTLMQDEQGEAVAAFAPVNDYTVLVYSDPSLQANANYSFWAVSTVTGSQYASLYTDITAFENAQQLETSAAGRPGGARPSAQQGGPGAMQPPEGETPPEGAPSFDTEPPQRPSGDDRPEAPSTQGEGTVPSEQTPIDNQTT